MASAGFGSPGHADRVDQPWGHLPRSTDQKQDENQKTSGDPSSAKARPPAPSLLDNVSALGPAGTVHVSIPDWARFARLHLDSATDTRRDPATPRLLKPETLQTLHTAPEGSTYAGGWVVAERDWAGGKALTHVGSNTVWVASIWLAPARDLAFFAATNVGGEVAIRACDQAITALILRP
jgi:CubicO group peptidase (beta-lactamase class C family)